MKKIILIAVLGLGLFFLGSFFEERKQFNQGVIDKETTTTKTQIKEIEVPALTLKGIFNGQKDYTKYPVNEVVSLVMTGDVIPGRHVNAKVVGYGDFRHPFLKTADYLKTGDITITNLEAPLVEGCPVNSTGMTFCGDPRHVQGLKYAGIDIAGLANNHSGNYGVEGIAETRAFLRKNGIEPVGYKGPVSKTVKGLKFTFLAYNGVTADFDLAEMEQEIKAADKTADVVVVMPHWGGEYSRVPKVSPGIANADPRALGKKLVDWGADLVLGNHPHWYQGVEIYKNKLIAYAHGNFVFDQEWSEETTLGFVGKYYFYKGKLIDVEFKPTKIVDYNQPYFLSGAKANETITIMKENSWE